MGYSRGADIMPFVANRLPIDARARVGLLALLGLSGRASFQFHWIDILRDSHRPTDLPVAPELERLRGTRILCVYGDDEKDSACRGIDRTLAIPVERDGAHRIYGSDAPDLARTIVAALPG
jgi:type IV secretory pathway VirJ component